MGLSIGGLKKWFEDAAGTAANGAAAGFHGVNVFDGGQGFTTKHVVQNPGQRTTFERGFDQVNQFDNGRSWENAMPVNDRSFMGQLTHNGATNTVGNLTYKPVANTALSIYDLGKTRFDMARNAPLAQQVQDANNLESHWHGSIPGFLTDQTINAGKTLGNLPRAIQGDVMGGSLVPQMHDQGFGHVVNQAGFLASNPVGFAMDKMGHGPHAPTQQQQAAYNQGAQALNQTVVGQMVSPVEGLMGDHGGEDMRNALRQGGYNVDATGAQKYFANPVMGAIGTYGLVKGGENMVNKGRTEFITEPTQFARQAAVANLIEQARAANDPHSFGNIEAGNIRVINAADRALANNGRIMAEVDGGVGAGRTAQGSAVTQLPIAPPEPVRIAQPTPAAQPAGVRIQGAAPEAVTIQGPKVAPGPETAVSKFPERLLEEPRTDPIHTSILGQSTHEVLHNKDVLDATAKNIAQNEDQALAFAKRGSTTEANATALQLLDKYLAEGQMEKADDLLKSINPRFTRQGQETQILAAYSKLTPAGAVRYASQQLDKAARDNPKSGTVDIKAEQLHKDLQTTQKEAAQQIADELSAGKLGPAIKAAQSGGKQGVKIVDKQEKTPAQMLADRIKSSEERKTNEPDPIKDMVNTLHQVAKQVLPETTKKLPRDPMQLIGQAVKDKTQYKDVWQKAQDIVAEKYQNNPAALEELDKYFSSNLSRPFSKNQLNRGVQTGLKGTDLGKLVRQHYTKVDETGRDLQQKLVDQAGLTPEEAKQLSGDIQKRFGELTQARKDSILKQMFNDKKTTPEQKSAVQKVLEMSNLGAFSRDDIRPLVAEKFGIPSLSKEAAANIRGMADDIQKLPEGSQERVQATAQMMQYIAKQVPSTGADKAVNFWRAGLLSSPITTAGNILGNATEAATRNAWANPVATASDAVFSLFTGKRTKIASGGQFSGGVEGLGKAGSYLKTGVDERNPITKLDGVREVNYGDGKVGSAVGKYVNGVYRWMGGQDQPFYYAAKHQANLEMARADAHNMGLKGADAESYVNQALQNPTWEPQTFHSKSNDITAGKYAVYQNDTLLGHVAAGAKNYASQHSPLGGAITQFLLPFSQVPASVAMRIIDRTPVGIAKEAVSQWKAGEFDQRAMSEAIGNGTFAPGVIAVGYALASNGDIAGNYPTDPKEQELWKMEGKQANSVRIGNRWYSTNYMQPFGAFLTIGAQVHDDHKAGKSPEEIIANATATSAKSVESQSFLQGVNGVLSAVNDPERSANKYITTTASSAVPNFIRTTARATDPKQRDQKGIVQGVQSAIPGAREHLPAKQDAFGRDLPRNDNTANQLFNPLRPSIDRSHDPVVSELQRLQDANNGIMPTQFNKTTFAGKDGKGFKLNDQQVRDLQAQVGPQAYAALQQTISDPRYQQLDDASKATAIKGAMDNAQQYGKNAFILGNSDKIASGGGDNIKLASSSGGNVTIGGGSQNDYLQKAANQNAIADFTGSKDKTKLIGDTYYFKTKDGSVKSMPKIEYDFNVANSKLALGMDRAQAANDIGSWMKLAEQQYNALEQKKQLYDPATEPDKLDAIQLQQENLMQKVEKYQEYGGFKKGSGAGVKKGSLPSIDVSIPSGLSSPVVSQSSYTAPKITLKNKGGVRVAARKRGSVKLSAPKKI